MKKTMLIAVIAIVAMLFASCDPNAGKPETDTLEVPEWAVGEYTGKVLFVMDGALAIDETSFAIDVTSGETKIITVASNKEGVKIESQKIDDEALTWDIVLSGITLDDGTAVEGNVSVNIKEAGENNENLDVTVEIPGMFEDESALVINFTPATPSTDTPVEETPADPVTPEEPAV